MAITKIHRITSTLNKALDYIKDINKTDDTLLITGYGCSPEIADIEFEQVRRNAMKPGGTLAFHLIQSFAPGEVDYETAHKIGVELADKVLRNRFQYVVATHIDKDHIHNHTSSVGTASLSIIIDLDDEHIHSSMISTISSSLELSTCSLSIS